jgi:putative NADH-flavin reductase
MHIALIGTGFVGAAVLDELLSRGHRVTVLARHPDKLAPRAHLAVVQADAQDAAQVAAHAEGADALVSAYNPGWSDPEIHANFLKATRAILAGAQRAGVRRLLMVGGAGSLYVAPGVQLVDTPTFPAEWKQGALAAREALEIVRGEESLDWTFVSPAVFLVPGERTGRYRLGADAVLMAGDKPASISVQDLAVAIVDELEAPKHVKRRFTAAN